jgi:predicted MPP superfamily phosphohydrolase
VDLALALWILLRQPDRPIDVGRVLLAATLVCFSGLVKVILSVAQSFFLVIHIVYADVMIVVPGAGLAVLLASRTRKVTKPALVLAWTSLLLVPVGIDATFIEPFRLVTETARLEVPREREVSRSLVIAVLSDIQCVEVTDRERDAIARVMAARPDLILLPGDLQQVGFDHRDEIAPALRDLLAPLQAPLGVYYVEGNTETMGEARSLLAGTPVRVLDDEIVRLEQGGTRVTICGVGLRCSGKGARATVAALQADPDPGDLRILLAHRPDAVLELGPRSRVDLVVAGHTHGGQVQLPWFGPPITLSHVPRAVAAGGLHDVKANAIYVSRGIGWEHGHAPRVRFLCTPEVSLLTLARNGEHE